MADATRPDCGYSASGHLIHPIQVKLAHRAGPPRPLRIVGTHEKGIYVVPVDAIEPVETWCMHAAHRERARRAIALGEVEILGWTHGLGKISDGFVSYTTLEGWRDCPPLEELRYWERSYFTREQMEAEEAAGRGRGSVR